MVVGDVRQWGPVLAQCVVTGIGVVVVVTERNICHAKHTESVCCNYITAIVIKNILGEHFFKNKQS